MAYVPIAVAPGGYLAQRGAALLAILAGAVAGALLLGWSLAASLAPAAAVTLAVGARSRPEGRGV